MGGFSIWHILILAIILAGGLFVAVHHDFAGVPHPGFASSWAEVADHDLRIPEIKRPRGTARSFRFSG